MWRKPQTYAAGVAVFSWAVLVRVSAIVSIAALWLRVVGSEPVSKPIQAVGEGVRRCYFISKVTYTQQGIGATERTSVSAGGATWVVAGVPGNLGVFSDDPSLSGTVDLSSLRLTSVPVSITVSLFASTGSVAVTDASVHVELLPLPPDSIAP